MINKILYILGLGVIAVSVIFFNQITFAPLPFFLIIALTAIMEIFPVYVFADRKLRTVFIPIFTGGMIFGPLYLCLLITLVGFIDLMKHQKYLASKLSEMLIVFFPVGLFPFVFKVDFSRIRGFDVLVPFLSLIAFFVLEIIIGTIRMLAEGEPNKKDFWVRVFDEIILAYILFTLLTFLFSLTALNLEILEISLFSFLLLAYHAILIILNRERLIQYDLVTATAKAIDARNEYMVGHSASIKRYAIAIAKEMNFAPRDIEKIAFVAQLHDLGRMDVENVVVGKKSKLSKAEYRGVKEHVLTSEKFVRDTKHFNGFTKIVRHHHEFYSGLGYPDGLKAEEIPIESRVIAVADAFDAMTKPRPHRKTKSYEEAQKELCNYSDTQFDPEVVNAFLRAWEKGIGKQSEPYAYILGY